MDSSELEEIVQTSTGDFWRHLMQLGIERRVVEHVHQCQTDADDWYCRIHVQGNFQQMLWSEVICSIVSKHFSAVFHLSCLIVYTVNMFVPTDFNNMVRSNTIIIEGLYHPFSYTANIKWCYWIIFPIENSIIFPIRWKKSQLKSKNKRKLNKKSLKSMGTSQSLFKYWEKTLICIVFIKKKSQIYFRYNQYLDVLLLNIFGKLSLLKKL